MTDFAQSDLSRRNAEDCPFCTSERSTSNDDDLKATRFFLSDGQVEQYISRSYTDVTDTVQTLSVDAVGFTANLDVPLQQV